VNSPLRDTLPLSAEELSTCRVPLHLLEFSSLTQDELEEAGDEGELDRGHVQTEIYKGPARRQSRASLQQIVYGTLLVLDIRLNYLEPSHVEYQQKHFAQSVQNGTLSAALGQFGFCRAGVACSVELVCKG
jgi:hypothetical protein